MTNWRHHDARAAYISMRIREEEARLKESEDARRLSRYDEAVRLHVQQIERCVCGMPKPCDIAEILEQIASDPENLNNYCEHCVEVAAFLAAEPKGVGA